MRRPWRRPPPYAVGIAGLAASASTMLPGRLYAVVAPSASGGAMPPIAAGCLAGAVADALHNGGKAVALLRSAADDFLALLAAHAVDGAAALAGGQLIVLQQADGYGDKLIRHGAQRFVDELDYLGVQRRSLVAVEHAERLFSAQDERRAAEQARIYQAWAQEAGATGLLLFQTSERDTVVPAALRALDDRCAGLAFLRSEGARALWEIAHWLSPLGSISQREYGLGFDPDGTLLRADGSELEGIDVRIRQAPDQDRVIATRAVVDGERGTPAHWRVVRDLGELLEAAEGAIAATCLIEFQGGDRLRVLARAVHYLRRTCGRGLRIVVRERKLRLRYNDELLLLRLGANTVVYAEVGFSRFLSLLESLRGQAYGDAIPDDFENAVQAALPPPRTGYLTPAAFCDMVRASMAQSAHIGVESTLACLYLLPETAHLDALRACRTGRPGDLFTADERSIWIFLYACREPDADATLDRAWREPLAQRFEGHVRFFSPTDILGAIDGLERRLYSAPLADYSAPLAAAAQPSAAPATPAAPAMPAATFETRPPVMALSPERTQAVAAGAQRRATRQPLRLAPTDGGP